MRYLLIAALSLLASCGAVKRWAQDAAGEFWTDTVQPAVEKKVGEVDGKVTKLAEKQLTPDELEELKSKAAEAGFVDEEGNIRWLRWIGGGGGSTVVLAAVVMWLRRRGKRELDELLARMKGKVGELWKAKADAEPSRPAAALAPPR